MVLRLLFQRLFPSRFAVPQPGDDLRPWRGDPSHLMCAGEPRCATLTLRGGSRLISLGCALDLVPHGSPLPSLTCAASRFLAARMVPDPVLRRAPASAPLASRAVAASAGGSPTFFFDRQALLLRPVRCTRSGWHNLILQMPLASRCCSSSEFFAVCSR